MTESDPVLPAPDRSVDASLGGEDPPRALPWDAKVVATLFLVTGSLALVRMVLGPFRNHFLLDLSVLGLPIGLGLLARRPGWRIAAQVMLWIDVVLACVGFVASFLKSPTYVKVLGVRFDGLGASGSALLAVFSLGALALAAWQLRVLERADVRELFETR